MENAWKKYRKTGVTEMRPYERSNESKAVSISEADEQEILDIENGLTNTVGMVARNADNHKDMWYIAKKYFKENYEEV